MNVDLPNELRDTLKPWTDRLPPGADDPYYTARYRNLIARGMHPLVAAIEADDYDTRHRNAHRPKVA